jgi:hypothetical protein
VSDDGFFSNEYLDLPDDPEEAFAASHRRKYKELEDCWARETDSCGWYNERRYVDTLVAFDEAHDIGLLTAYRNPPNSDREFGDFFHDFRPMQKLGVRRF